MGYTKEDIIKALEICSLSSNSTSCEQCPLKEECDDNPFISVPSKYALEVIRDLM
jgi:hypothetical protein